jgi:hypothetical protein
MKLDNLLSLHEETTTRCREIMRQKNMDYSGGDGDPFANFRIAESFGLHPVTGIILRMTDKLQRVRAFIKNGVCAVDGESVDDACDDLVNYAILMKGLLREERASKAVPGHETLEASYETVTGNPPEEKWFNIPNEVEPQYRRLNSGERIKTGDQFKTDLRPEWSAVSAFLVGSPFDYWDGKLEVRRPL